MNYVETNFLENYIYTATRGQTILDLVFSNNHQLVSNYSTTVNNKFSDHHLLTVTLNFTYNQENISSKSVNPTSTRIYDYDVKNASKSDWKRFEKILQEISKNYEDESKDLNTEDKLKKVYEYAERATSIVFQKKKDFSKGENIEDTLIKPKNKVPKRIRILLRKKKKLSSKILSSTSWRKNYKIMIELREVEE